MEKKDYVNLLEVSLKEKDPFSVICETAHKTKYAKRCDTCILFGRCGYLVSNSRFYHKFKENIKQILCFVAVADENKFAKPLKINDFPKIKQFFEAKGAIFQ